MQRLTSEAALNTAKAQSAEIDPQLKASELQSKLLQKREELSLRERLSEMTNNMRKDQSDTAAAAKMAAEAMRNISPTGGTE